jgi:hypothetical protein
LQVVWETYRTQRSEVIGVVMNLFAFFLWEGAFGFIFEELA